MALKTIAIGCDHAAFALKQTVMAHLEKAGYSFCDFGTYSEESCDYPDIAAPVARAVAAGEYDCGVLLCGTGIGMSITANKIKGVRAALCSDAFSTEATRCHNNANVICMGARVLSEEKALELLDIFLTTDYEGGRHQRRLDKIAAIENE